MKKNLGAAAPKRAPGGEAKNNNIFWDLTKKSIFSPFSHIFLKFVFLLVKTMAHFPQIYIYFFNMYDRKNLVANFHICDRATIFYQSCCLCLLIKNGKNV